VKDWLGVLRADKGQKNFLELAFAGILVSVSRNGDLAAIFVGLSPTTQNQLIE